MLRVTEIFCSIQGESTHAGRPCTFVRLTGCPMRCVWCDTRYASWDPEGPVVPVSELVAQTASAAVKHVVLTGGEPMLFDAIVPLASALKGRGSTITIETAGTVYREVACDLMSISPKLSNSVPDEESGWTERHEATRLNDEALGRLMEAYDCQLKFVITSAAEVSEIVELLSRLPCIAPERVLLMAEGTTVEAQRERQRWIAQVCVERGWRLSPRLHIDLFGNTRGT